MQKKYVHKGILLGLALLSVSALQPIAEINPLAIDEEITFDFGKNKEGEDWFIMDDDVMGGYSKGTMTLTENSLRFSGVISLRNNGGYTFVRKPFGALNLGNSSQVEIRYRSEGQTMGISFNNTTAWYKPYYKLYLKDTGYKWKTVELDLSDAIEYTRGKPSKNTMPPELVKEMKRIGFCNTDLKEGPFRFEVDYLIFR